jgi:predicted methyltransferase
VPRQQLTTKGKPAAIAQLAADPAYGNVKLVIEERRFADGVHLPAPADVLWTSRNYHDFRLKQVNLDVLRMNRSIFAALKPGGTYSVVDHAAAAGASADVADTLHRVDPALVRRDAEAAGFEFVAASKALANAADDHGKSVFSAELRDHTDQFVYKFRKPKRR